MVRQAKKPQIRKSTAQERFTDRRDPVRVFEEKYDEIKRERGSMDVIHYYGEGGIGKSALLSKIMDDQVEYGHKNVIMFSFKATQDKMLFMSVLAREIGSRVYNADFTVFYYAYAKYLKECGLSDTQIEARIRNSDQTGLVLSETAKTTINFVTDFLPAGGNTVGKLGELFVDFISRCINEEKQNGKKEDKEIIYKIDGSRKDELEKELQVYFAADCHRFMNDITEPFVILLDDYEYMNDRVKHGNSHEDLWLCDAYEGLVNLLPNTLWVIAGRDRINWSNDILPEENCHLLGALGRDDASDFFRKARDPKGNSMEADLIEGLHKLTGGIPVYMDMCFGRFESGRCHQIEEFGKNTEDIAQRYFKDRETEERTAIEFICCLTSVWSDEMKNNVLDRIKSDVPYDVCLQLKLKGIKEQTYVEKIGNQYKIHDVYRKVVRDNVDKGELKKISDATYKYLVEIISDEKLTQLDRVNALKQLDQNIEDYLLIEAEIRDGILRNCGLLEDIGKYYDYKELASRLVSVYKKIADDNPTNDNRLKALYAKTQYANSCECIGDIKESFETAKSIYSQILTIQDENHPDVLIIKNSLAIIYHEMGEFIKAKELYEEVLNKSTIAYGERNPNTITIKNNLASVFNSLGEYDEALKLYKDVLEKRREVLGDENTDTITAKNNLAVTYENMGEYKKAEELCTDALQELTEMLGDNHPHTIMAMNNLALIYDDLGEDEKALELKMKVIEKLTEIRGDNHPETIIAMNNLAITYDNMGENKKALELHLEVLKRFMEILGENHPNTIMAKHGLASTYGRMGDYDKSEKLFTEVLEKQRVILGEEHHDTIMTISNLALTYSYMGKFEDALKLNKETLKKLTEKLDGNHPDTIMVMHNLASTYGKMGNYEESLRLFQEILEKRRAILGEEHHDTITAMHDLASAYNNIGEYEKAIELYTEVLNKLTKKPGDEHPDTIMTMNNLALAYYNNREYVKALELYEKQRNLANRVIPDEVIMARISEIKQKMTSDDK